MVYELTTLPMFIPETKIIAYSLVFKVVFVWLGQSYATMGNSCVFLLLCVVLFWKMEPHRNQNC